MFNVLIDASTILNFKSGYGRYLKHLLLGFRDYCSNTLKLVLLLNKNAKFLDFYFSDFDVEMVNISKKFILYRYQFQRELYSISKKIDIWHSIASAPPLSKIDSKIVLTVHDLAYLYYPQAYTLPSLFYWKHIYPLGLKKSDRLIAISMNTKKDIIKHYNIDENKIFVIYNAVFLENKHILDSLHIPLELPFKYILYVGAINPRKNVVRLLEGFYLAKKKNKIVHKLLLVGSFSWNSIELNKYLDKYGLKNEVVIIKDVEDKYLYTIYKNADLFVYPSLYEGFGYPPLEAMLFQVPVISSVAPPLPEILEDAAMYFDPHSSEDLCEKICYLLDNLNERNRLIERGLKRASYFSLEKMIGKVINLYKGLF